MDSAIFELGEKKYVCISVRSTCGKPFDKETILSALIQPMIKGATYILEYTYEIPPEIIKHVVRVMVK